MDVAYEHDATRPKGDSLSDLTCLSLEDELYGVSNVDEDINEETRRPQGAFNVGNRGEASDKEPKRPRNAMSDDEFDLESNRMGHEDQVTGVEKEEHGT